MTLAQAHEVTAGPYTLRSSTVSSLAIDSGTAKAHGIAPAPELAVLNVTLIAKTGPGNGTVPARVVVTARDLAGRGRSIGMSEDRENGYVSYFGTYRHSAGERLKFEIKATPEDGERALILRYQDRVWP